MAVPLDSTSSPKSEHVLRELEAERKREASERIAGWAVVWTLFAFKMATIVIIWFAANGSAEANAYITVTTWYWMAIPAVALSGFVGYRLRLRKARQQADRLRQAEFMEHTEVYEPFIITDEEVRKLMALESRRNENDRPGEG
jgi:hypothetical protein